MRILSPSWMKDSYSNLEFDSYLRIYLELSPRFCIKLLNQLNHKTWLTDHMVAEGRTMRKRIVNMKPILRI